jgi:hypothetical protein
MRQGAARADLLLELGPGLTVQTAYAAPSGRASRKGDFIAAVQAVYTAWSSGHATLNGSNGIEMQVNGPV